ncbi:MAG TPA: GntR family transcriptional regulator [Pseudonocardiaceae bacterium]|nr:GntR family transcriptional regulator [Pseudonocardiaceae bacterium]
MMSAESSRPTPVTKVVPPPSMATLAADALRAMILSGDLRPGERIVENQLTEQLGVSRPPLREALMMLVHEGLVVQHPRRGAVVTPLTQHDVYEIVTLRAELEMLAVTLGIPVRTEELLRPCRRALDYLVLAAEAGDEAAATGHAFAFHLAVVSLAENRRLTESYRSLGLQMQLCMAMNRGATKAVESLTDIAQRHRELLSAIESGDQQAVRDAFYHHGHQQFLAEAVDQLDGPSPQSTAWLRRMRGH